MPAKCTPKYGHHKPTNQARVRIDGTDHYLGPYNSPESRAAYDRLIAEWMSTPVQPGVQITVDALSLAYLAFAKEYYKKDGETTSHVAAVRSALRYCVRSYGPEKAAAFGPKKLKAVRQAMINRGIDDQEEQGTTRRKPKRLSRKHINRLVDIIKRAFKWAASEELLPGAVAVNLSMVQGLREGRSEAREIAPVEPVDDVRVDATIPHLLPQLVAMIEIQRLTGARPGEITRIRPCDITIRADGAWCYRPSSHKNQHRKKERLVFLGPKAQELLRPWMERPADSYCFSPREAREEKFRRQREARKTKVQPSQFNRRRAEPKRLPGLKYTNASYGKAVLRACVKHNIEPWHPNQLRHSHGTRVRKEFGLEAAQVVLGHSNAAVTQIYAERNMEEAARVQLQVG